MQVGFKGLYVIAGNWESARCNKNKTGVDTIHDISNRKLTAFLEDTKKMRDSKASIYYDNQTQDLYIPVKNDKEGLFEETAEDYNIDCSKVADRIIRNSSKADKIVETLNNFRFFGFNKK